MKTVSALIILLFAGGVLYAAYPDEFPLYLRLLGFTKDDIRHLSEGRFVVERYKDPRPGEEGITAAKVLNVPGYYVRDYYTYIENFRSLRDFQAVGKFKADPDLRDLAPLSFEPGELQEFTACAQHCSLNLTEEEIAGIGSNANPEDLYRNILLDRLRNYLKDGNKTGTYLKDFSHLSAYFPLVVRYSDGYPDTRDRRVPEFYYWVKDPFGDRNVVQIRHVFSQRIQDDFVIVDQLVYSTHSLMASAFVLHLINYADGGHPRTLLVYHGRTYVDPEIGRSARTDRRVFAAFRAAGEELEKRYVDRQYVKFPHGIVVSDQR